MILILTFVTLILTNRHYLQYFVYKQTFVILCSNNHLQYLKYPHSATDTYKQTLLAILSLQTDICSISHMKYLKYLQTLQTAIYLLCLQTAICDTHTYICDTDAYKQDTMHSDSHKSLLNSPHDNTFGLILRCCCSKGVQN